MVRDRDVVSFSTCHYPLLLAPIVEHTFFFSPVCVFVKNKQTKKSCGCKCMDLNLGSHFFSTDQSVCFYAITKLFISIAL